MKTGLVMEGGAMRGLFTAGVIDVMMENGIEYDGAIGVSAGAAFGCNYKSHQIGRVIRYNTTFAHDHRMCSIRNLVFTGDLYGADFCYNVLPRQLDVMDEETYLASPMKFYVVATDTETGQAVYHELDDLGQKNMDWMRASASMPVVSRPVEIDGKTYLDGGISDSIPLKAFEDMGYERNVVILTRPKGYFKKPQSMKKAMDMMLRKYPAIAEALRTRHLRYNDTLMYIERQKRDGKAYVIYPRQPLAVGKVEHDPQMMRQAYYEGRLEGQRHLETVRKFLEEAHEQ